MGDPGVSGSDLLRSEVWGDLEDLGDRREQSSEVSEVHWEAGLALSL